MATCPRRARFALRATTPASSAHNPTDFAASVHAAGQVLVIGRTPMYLGKSLASHGSFLTKRAADSIEEMDLHQ